MNDFTLENFKKFAQMLSETNNQWSDMFMKYAESWEQDTIKHNDTLNKTADFIETMNGATKLIEKLSVYDELDVLAEKIEKSDYEAKNCVKMIRERQFDILNR